MLRLRIVLLTAMVLTPSAGWSQDEACSQRCSDSIGTCMSGCSVDSKCSSTCANRLSQCLGRCMGPKAQKAPMNKKCLGANGKPIQCPNFTPPPPPKEIPPPPDQK